ncbi:carbohydrate ABC transporter permease [Enterococcus gallinarum]|uniref:carbohydrate ABC transporter permease n=1 Tax=Enterococcus gallinarum TaxID=1353 RepID=UPI001D17BB17|nr:sugar ABC transporter permease [Enterococcus gallinarum]MCC4044738.1 sugar ABC transporter permease [Enterococcus gallinarum]
MNKSTTKWAWLFLSPQLVGLIIFSLIPVVIAIGLSFMSWDGFGARTFVGIQNYINQFSNPDFWIATYNTLLYTLLTVPIGLSLALVLAVALNKRTGKNVYRLFFFMPVVTSSVSVSVMWMWILNGDIGILNQVLGMIGIQGPNWLTDTRIVMLSIAVLSIWWQLGYNMVIFLAGIQNISKSYYEAAQMDGASKLQQFFNITLPMLSPTTFFLSIMAIISSFQVFDQAFVLTRGGPGKASYTLVYHIYQQAFIDFRFGSSAAGAVILFAAILVLTLIQFYAQKRWVHYEE